MAKVLTANKRETAQFFGVTTQALDRWIDAGCPVLDRDTHGDVAKLDLSDVAKWRVQRAMDAKDPINLRLSTEDLEAEIQAVVAKFIFPLLADRAVRRRKVLAEEFSVPEVKVRDLLVFLLCAMHYDLGDFFQADELDVDYSAAVTAEMRASGDRRRAAKGRAKGSQVRAAPA